MKELTPRERINQYERDNAGELAALRATQTFDFDYHERSERWEIATSAIGNMISMCSHMSGIEEKSTHPDPVLLAKIDRERGAFAREQLDLRFEDDLAVQRVLDVYCPVIKAHMKELRSQLHRAAP